MIHSNVGGHVDRASQSLPNRQCPALRVGSRVRLPETLWTPWLRNYRSRNRSSRAASWPHGGIGTREFLDLLVGELFFQSCGRVCFNSAASAFQT